MFLVVILETTAANHIKHFNQSAYLETHPGYFMSHPKVNPQKKST